MQSRPFLAALQVVLCHYADREKEQKKQYIAAISVFAVTSKLN